MTKSFQHQSGVHFFDQILNLHKAGYDVKTIQKMLSDMEPDYSPSIRTVYRVIEMGKRGERPATTHHFKKVSLSKKFESKILDAVRENRNITQRTLSEMFPLSRTSISMILTKNGWRWKRNVWIPHDLDERQKKKRVELATAMKNRLENLRRGEVVVTEDESWVFYENPFTHSWTLDGEAPQKVAKLRLTPKKLMVTAFISPLGVHALGFLPYGESMTKERFADCLEKLRDDFAKRRPSSGLEKVILHMDNCRVHPAALKIARERGIEVETLPHPPYSPDLAPCDFFLWGAMKEELKGKSFKSEKELMDSVNDFCKRLDKKLLSRVYQEWKERLQTCIDREGKYLL